MNAYCDPPFPARLYPSATPGSSLLYGPGFYPVGPGLGVVPGGRHGRHADPPHFTTLPDPHIPPAPVSDASGSFHSVDPQAEEEYWRDNYWCEPYFNPDAVFDDYGPAYRAGLRGFLTSNGARWSEAETVLERSWVSIKGRSRLTWNQAKHAARAAWQRVETRLPQAG